LHGLRRLLDAKRFDELVQEKGNSICQLHARGFGRGPLSDLQSTSIDQISSMDSEEFVEHAKYGTGIAAFFSSAANTGGLQNRTAGNHRRRTMFE
jgi:hypothetical protein